MKALVQLADVARFFDAIGIDKPLKQHGKIIILIIIIIKVIIIKIIILIRQRKKMKIR